jgi:hypothetical protein
MHGGLVMVITVTDLYALCSHSQIPHDDVT